MVFDARFCILETYQSSHIMHAMNNQRQMKFSTRMLMVLTPVGVLIGLYEAWHLAGGLVVLLAAQILVMAAAATALVRTIRRESK